MRTYGGWRWLSHRLRGHQKHAIKDHSGIPCWLCTCGKAWRLDPIAALFIDLTLWGTPWVNYQERSDGFSSRRLT